MHGSPVAALLLDNHDGVAAGTVGQLYRRPSAGRSPAAVCMPIPAASLIHNDRGGREWQGWCARSNAARLLPIASWRSQGDGDAAARADRTRPSKPCAGPGSQQAATLFASGSRKRNSKKKRSRERKPGELGGMCERL
ncbi:hypothetical protein C2845_PM16G19960 [Panicum miliaceum]|uniref:Uncharacterized protein n=1 Tax=Panicum miliaceum TaxID=4540 RepID=A0A3L6PVG3_PANMI|nr:hypothetical protein C2845_PM16G19960 [Panicum miliaceum]